MNGNISGREEFLSGADKASAILKNYVIITPRQLEYLPFLHNMAGGMVLEIGIKNLKIKK